MKAWKPRLTYPTVPLAALVLVACGGGSGKSTAGLPTQPAASAPGAPGLVTFNHTGFAIGLVPGMPKRTALSLAQQGISVKLVLYYAQQGDVATGIGSFSRSFDQAAMKAAIAGGARTAGGTVHDEAATTYQGFPARDARIPSNASGGTLFVRTISTPTRTYLLEYIVKGTDHTSAPAGYAKFLSSLKLG